MLFQKFMLYNEMSAAPIVEENGNINKGFTNDDEKNKNEKYIKMTIENSFSLAKDYIDVTTDKSVVMTNVFAKWNDTISDYTLNNVNINFKGGEFAAIIGPVGSGKVMISVYYSLTLKRIPALYYFKHVPSPLYVSPPPKHIL